MGVVSGYTRIKMKLVAGQFLRFFQEPVEKHSAMAALTECTPADKIIHIENPSPSQEFSDTITCRRDYLVV